MTEKTTSPTSLLNPCNSSVFKRLFTDSSPESNKALKCFLEVILQKTISDIVIQKDELPIEAIFNKESKYNVNCHINETEFASIEIQNCNYRDDYTKRVEYCIAQLLDFYPQKNGIYKNIEKVYQIVLLNFIQNKDCKKELFHYTLLTEDGLHIEEQQNIIFIELPKIHKIVESLQCKTKTVKSLTAIQKWCIFFLYAQNNELSPIIQEIAQSDEGIMNAITVLKEISKYETE